MTLNLSQLRERVCAAQFSDVEQVDDSIIRFTKKSGAVPFAVYYVDFGQDLPESQEKLTNYQDRVIGSHYFEGRKSLQWNNYLYFITSRDRLALREVFQAKELIESDRSYARKFVISEEELDSVLLPKIVAPADATPHAGILSIWTGRLFEAGLDKAILSDHDLPKRIKLIESLSAGPTIRPKTTVLGAEVEAAQYIRELELNKFRDFPNQRRFKFGMVNLIFGANGSGKTCLLEAIELFYCGRNKRNPKVRPAYELVAVLEDGRIERATDNRRAQIFRNRNLNWYGQPEVKTNDLCMSFAQFNFLDTDAAVGLADSTDQIKENLSKLLVGPDASKIWKNIERVDEAVAARLRDLRPLKTQIDEELHALEEHLKETSDARLESDSIQTRLEEMIHRIGWSGANSKKETFVGWLVGALSELVSLSHQAAVLNWLDSPVSIGILATYCHEAKDAINRAEADIARLELMRKNQRHREDSIKRDREASDLIRQAKLLIEVGVPERVTELIKQQNTVATYSGWLAGLDPDTLGALSNVDLELTAAICHEAAVATRSVVEEFLATAKSEYENFSKFRDQALNLAQELRQVAAKILQSGSDPDKCPLCHTQFGTGELAKHISVGVDEHLEALGQRLLTHLRERESAMREAIAVDAASDWLRKFCERASFAADISVGSALSEVENAKRAIAKARSRLEILNSEILTLESQGFLMARLEEISARLRELGYPLSEFSEEAADRLLSTIDQDSGNLSRTLEAERKQAEDLQKKLEAILSYSESGVNDLKGALSQLKERLAATESLRAKLVEFSSSFPWSERKPLAELAVEAESVRKVATELQTALGRERQALDSYTESRKRKEHLQGQLAELITRMNRLKEAQSTLRSLRREHSLTMGMESALQQNRASIEDIFLRIHSPAEFRGLGLSLTTLVRKVDGSEANLREISTGQRSAFALSIFLAQNSQLTVAPPVVLIDDPIAHVDDMNSLSFLDYLRDVSLMGRRQIFFTTANEKLAALFERKFDFLGDEDFRRIKLSR